MDETTRPGRVRLQVSDLPRSLAYYQGVLGLSLIDRSPGTAVLGGAGGKTPLVVLRERVGARPVPRSGRLGLYHFAILVPSRAALARFVRHLAEHDVPSGMSDHDVSEAIYLHDPDNLGIEVYADRPRTRWRWRGRQLVMTTLPLDVQSLLSDAGHEPWTGMPEDTRIGHVHLHVGDLEEAAAFYHEALGFDKVVWSYPGALFLSAGGYHHHLGTNTWVGAVPPAAEDEARLLEWEIVLSSDEAAAAAARSVADRDHPITETDNGWLAADPWGTVVRVRREAN